MNMTSLKEEKKTTRTHIRSSHHLELNYFKGFCSPEFKLKEIRVKWTPPSLRV